MIRICATAVLLGWLGYDLALFARDAADTETSVLKALQMAALSCIWLCVLVRKPVSPNFMNGPVVILVLASMTIIPAAVYFSSTPTQESLVGYIIMTSSAALLLWSSIFLRGSFTIFPAAIRIRTRGPYRFIRHPIYCSYVMGTCGVIFLIPDPVVALAALMEAVMLWNRAKVEEHVLARMLPTYRDYTQRVRYRFLPGLI